MCSFSCDDPSNPSDCHGPTCPKDVHFYLLLDADRDGDIDADEALAVTVNASLIANWEWGKDKLGAVILCNNDDDDSASQSDHDDARINGGNDDDEIAPLVIARTGADPAPPSMRATLEVTAADAARIRIFDRRGSGATEIIGPTAGNTYDFPDLSFDKKEFGMEAVTYAKRGFDGLITITFSVRDPSGSYSHEGKVRVAPWIMPNHTEDAEKVYVVIAPATPAIVPGVDPIPSNAEFRRKLSGFVAAAGCALVQHSNHDVWMQDCMEFGYSSLPADKGIRAVMRATRNRPLKAYPVTLRAPNLGYGEPAPLRPRWPQENTFNSTGNLEVTPPCVSKSGKKYPFGRIYYGGVARSRPGSATTERFDAEVEEFLTQQVVQLPISVDTTWLAVGHVDEIISFVPAPGGFKMLLASPKLAYDILQAKKARHGRRKLLTGRRFPIFDHNFELVGWRNAEVSIQKFLDVGVPGMLRASGGHPGLPHASAARLKAFNNSIQVKLTAIKAQFENEIGIDASRDIIDVPILFIPNEDNVDVADALTAGMVNMLVINKHCIIPDPFGPVVGEDLFFKHVKDHLTPLGLTVHPLDDWHEYHIGLGEIHCGTNTLRKPQAAKWWEFEP